MGGDAQSGAPPRLRPSIVVFWAIHAACLAVFWVGVSRVALIACATAYALQMLGITGGYHRLLAHRTFRTHRSVQLVLAVLGASAAQQGPLWWAGQHRHHHRHTDTPDDVHSPRRGFWWSHIGWVASGQFLATRDDVVRDLAAYPELVFLDRHYEIVPVALAATMLGVGWWLGPALGTSAGQLFVWGFCVATTLSCNATFTVNSLAHRLGRRRFETDDDSRNNPIIGLLAFGEGWHNNHHRYPGSERQGFYWWEVDITHYVISLLALVGLAWDVKAPPASVYAEAARGPAGSA